jgi:hypothetical protein
MFFKHMIGTYGVPNSIITDVRTQLTCPFWTGACSYLSLNHSISTAFHPLTNRQTEPQNQTKIKYLQGWCNYKQDNWVELLRLVEFADNNTMHG